MLPVFIIGLFALYFLLFGLEIPRRRKLIEEYVAELENDRIEPTKKAGLEVLRWYNLLLDENDSGHYQSYLTPHEFNIVRDFLYECGINQMPAPEFRRRSGEFSRILSKTIGGIFTIIKVAIFVVALFLLGRTLLIQEPSAIGLTKMWAFIIIVPLAFALLTKGIKFVQAADE